MSKYRGTIDEFIGDGILVLFGAPISAEDDAKRVVACAVEMQLAIATVNEQMKQWGYSPIFTTKAAASRVNSRNNNY